MRRPASKFRFVILLSVVLVLLVPLVPLLRAQTVNRAKAEMTIGPIVQVSKAFATIPHYENLSAGDPKHPGRLITCSMLFAREPGKLAVEHCYVSFDNGQSWQPTLQITEGRTAADPTVTYGRDGKVYVVALVTKDLDKPREVDPESPREKSATVVYKSRDGGRTWQEASRFRHIDRPFIDIDKSTSSYAGRIYIVGQGVVRGISGSAQNSSLQLFRSLDDGKTFLGPVHAEYDGRSHFGVGTGAVMSDGTFVVIFGIVKKGRQQRLEKEPLLGPNAELHVISSKDGGETFRKSQKITDWTIDRRRAEGRQPQLALDPGSRLFKDRLYAVFPMIVADRVQIQTAFSTDGGQTWSKPVIVNDDRNPEQAGNGPDHLLPSVGVNKDGVVLVTWYDRRDSKDNLGWKLRAAASLDGGETFSASIPVAAASNAYPQTTPWDLHTDGYNDDKNSFLTLRVIIEPFFMSGGHTSGLAVTADGTFHPTWIDNHTGVAQLWSAPVEVKGVVTNHGSEDLAGLDDISKYVTIDLSRPTLDRITGDSTITAILKNTSNYTIQGPAKVRVLTLESEIGVPAIINSDNNQIGTGAVWDFSTALSRGSLPSLSASAPKALKFRFSDLRPFGPLRDFKYGLINLDVRVLGKLRK